MLTILRLFATITILTIMTSCGGGNSDKTALLRIVHGSPDAPSVDVFLDGVIVISNASYQTVSELLEFDTGIHNIKINATGTETTVIEVERDFSERTSTTILATNLLANIEGFLLSNDRTGPKKGNTRVRAIHGAPSAPAVDIYVVRPGTDITSAEPTLSNVSYKGASGYLEVPSGDYQVFVTVAGTKTVAIDSGTITLGDQKIFSVLALDATGGGAPFTAIIIEE